MGLFAGWSDFRGLQIPNTVQVVILLAFVPAYAAAHFTGVKVFAPLGSHVEAAGFTLMITFVMFCFRVFGGGDAKLLTVYALWVALKGMPPLLIYMAVSGFFLALVSLIIRKVKPFKNAREGSWIAQMQAGGNRVPYGIPIVIGALVAFFTQGYLKPQNLLLFVGNT
jgi:prepilin peptidase CpaA